MRLLKILIGVTFAPFLIAADISGGDLKLHDLQKLNNNLGVPSGSAVSSCGAPPVSPYVWLDGDDFTGGASLTGNQIWKDKGQSGKIYEFETAAKSPIASVGFMSFDGVDDLIWSSDKTNYGSLMGGTDYFCAYLSKTDAPTGASIESALLGTWLTGAAIPNWTNIIRKSGNDWIVINGGLGLTANDQNATTHTTNWEILRFEYDKTAAETRTCLDSICSSVTATNSALDVSNPINSNYFPTIGAETNRNSAGGSWSEKNYLNGDIAQVLCYDNLTDIVAAESWLSCKKGLL